MSNECKQKVLLFSRTKHGADRIVRNLKKKKIESAAIHGNKSQNQRQKALEAFPEAIDPALSKKNQQSAPINTERRTPSGARS